MKPIRVVLDAYLRELDAPEPPDGTVDLTAARIRRHVRRDELWRAGVDAEQLAFDFGGTAVAW